MKMRMRFTMVEMLIVIAIVMILAALLFPVVGSIRKRARFNAWQGLSVQKRKDPDVVGYYNMQEGSGDVLENTGTGAAEPDGWKATIFGATWDSGRWSKKGALKFDGSSTSYAIINKQQNTLDWPTGNLSIEIWLRSSTSGRTCFSYRKGVVNVDVDLTAAMADDKWHQVVMTTTNGSFLDGESSGGNITSTNNNGIIVIGQKIQSIAGSGDTTTVTFDNTKYFKGLIDEVTIYKRSLTQDEVKKLYKKGSPE